MGCGYCHTQQVRFADQDVTRFGAPTEAWETKYDYPQLWGTRRIGPDLAREGAIRSADWQLAHLYNPRLTVAGSIMPGFPWMYNGAPDKPKPEALALVAYVQSLGQARAQSGFDTQREGIPMNGGSSPDMVGMNRQPVTLNASATLARRTGSAPTFTVASDPVQREIDLRRGRDVFAANCASCHGDNGRGDGPAAAALARAPTDFHVQQPSGDYARRVLSEGVPGSAMPPWTHQLTAPQRQQLVDYVRSLFRASRPDGGELRTAAKERNP